MAYTPYPGDYNTYGENSGEWDWGFSNPLVAPSASAPPPSPGGSPFQGSPSPFGGSGSQGTPSGGSPNGGSSGGHAMTSGIAAHAMPQGSYIGSNPGPFDTGMPGNIIVGDTLGLGSLAPGIGGTLAGLGGMGLSAANASSVNGIMGDLGRPSIDLGGYLGAMIGGNPILGGLMGLGNQYGRGIVQSTGNTDLGLGAPVKVQVDTEAPSRMQAGLLNSNGILSQTGLETLLGDQAILHDPTSVASPVGPAGNTGNAADLGAVGKTVGEGAYGTGRSPSTAGGKQSDGGGGNANSGGHGDPGSGAGAGTGSGAGKADAG